MAHVPSLEALIHELGKLPGVGPKTAQRLGYFILKSKEEYVNALRQCLAEVKTRIHECPLCYSYTESTALCHFCADPKRDDEILCVVEDPSGITRVENSGVFKGRYHVLQGVISPLDGISPKDLKIQPLIERIEQQRGDPSGKSIKEVILALDADLEGDTTVLYLSQMLRRMEVAVTRIAHGVPLGGDLDYVDFRTLGRAIENRIQV
ncbi:MAG: recombination mediator RecR [Bdellovibrionales bacterium]|nr:recombination mediator RecR [Bdellovibrionales bacterium]